MMHFFLGTTVGPHSNNSKLISVYTFSNEQHIPAYSCYSFLQVHFGKFQSAKDNKGN